MTRTVAAVEQPEVLSEEDRESAATAMLNQTTLLMIPTAFFAQLSNAAARRNMTAAQLLRRAVAEFLDRTSEVNCGTP